MQIEWIPAEAGKRNKAPRHVVEKQSDKSLSFARWVKPLTGC